MVKKNGNLIAKMNNKSHFDSSTSLVKVEVFRVGLKGQMRK